MKLETSYSDSVLGLVWYCSSVELRFDILGTAWAVELIAKNIKRLRELKNFSQKEVCANSTIPQGQYSRIENGKVEPSISTLEKLATVFEVDIAEFFKSDDLEQEVNLPLMQKIKMIDTLAKDEQTALFKMIDMALSNKRMKDNLQTLIAQ
jgi:transcriptional regulator with XRE-family HTH domain